MSHLGVVALLAATSKKSGGSSSSFLLILIVGFGALWYFFLRPQQAKARKAREEAKTFEVGDEIVTVGGIVGTVIDVDGDRVTIVSGEGGDGGAVPTRLVLVRQAIARKAEPAAVASDDDDHDDDHEVDDHEHDEHDEHEVDDDHDDGAPGAGPATGGPGGGRRSFWRGRKDGTP
jgi:preprotein translocase subunit YajC